MFNKKYLPWSFTKLNALECPRYFQKRYIEKATYEIEPKEFLEGIEKHDLAEIIVSGKYEEEKEIPLPENVYLTLQKIKKFAEDKEIYTEKEFYSDDKLLEFSEERREDSVFHGKIDLIIKTDSELYIYDFKNRYDPQINERDLLQLKTYAFLSWKGEEKIKVGIIALNNNIEPLREMELKSDDIVKIDVKIRNLIRKAEKRLEDWEENGFRPSPSIGRCPFCYYKFSCPVSEEIKEDIDGTFRKIFILQNQLKDLKEKAKEYVKRRGKYLLSDLGVEFDLYPVYKTALDENVFHEICSRLHLEPNIFLKYDIEMIKKTAKLEEFQELLNALHYEIQYYRFDFKKLMP